MTVRPDRRPGQLTPGWRLLTGISWVLVFIAWSGVWKASRELGVATWWLGPVGEPRPVPVMLIPFVAPGVMVGLTLNNARRIPWYGLAAAAVSVAIGLVDLAYVRRLGFVEVLIGIAGALVSLAGFGGTYRAVPAQAPAATTAPPSDGPVPDPAR